MTTTTLPYRIVPARYAKGRMMLHLQPDGSKYKNRAARLAEALGGRWVHRENGYSMAPTKARKFEELYAEGWSATIITAELIPPPAK